MTAYATMTVGGMYGASYDAETAEEAARAAEADGYEVLDVAENETGTVLVVGDVDPTPDYDTVAEYALDREGP